MLRMRVGFMLILTTVNIISFGGPPPPFLRLTFNQNILWIIYVTANSTLRISLITFKSQKDSVHRQLDNE